MTTPTTRRALKHLRELGASDARAGKSINAFYELPLAGHHRHNERARGEYEIGYRAAKQEMRRELRARDHDTMSAWQHGDWLRRAPEDEQKRRDYFVRLLAILGENVPERLMQESAEKALAQNAPRDRRKEEPEDAP